MSTTVKVKKTTKHNQLKCETGLFAAKIKVLTAWLHIPTGAGYTHAGDGLIYLAASMLPTPYAMAAGAIGAGLADGLSGFVVWLPGTIVIKAITAFCFSRKRENNLREKSSRHYPCTCYMRGMQSLYEGIFMAGGFQRAQ
ncbi:MAG: ECF transporter S component [Ruminococcus bicirculans (ex Wegman et al. 2014)]